MQLSRLDGPLNEEAVPGYILRSGEYTVDIYSAQSSNRTTISLFQYSVYLLLLQTAVDISDILGFHIVHVYCLVVSNLVVYLLKTLAYNGLVEMTYPNLSL